MNRAQWIVNNSDNVIFSKTVVKKNLIKYGYLTIVAFSCVFTTRINLSQKYTNLNKTNYSLKIYPCVDISFSKKSKKPSFF